MSLGKFNNHCKWNSPKRAVFRHYDFITAQPPVILRAEVLKSQIDSTRMWCFPPKKWKVLKKLTESFQINSCKSRTTFLLPSGELIFFFSRHFWRWCSFSPGICDYSPKGKPSQFEATYCTITVCKLRLVPIANISSIWLAHRHCLASGSENRKTGTSGLKIIVQVYP